MSSRVQLALNVADVDAAVDFYTKLFGAEPAKRRPGYANFALDEPALKLVLIENPGSGGSLNHLGVEVDSSSEVEATQRRVVESGLDASAKENVSCCYAVQDKFWTEDPDGAPWEVYTVLGDASNLAPTPDPTLSQGRPCCGGSDEGCPSCGGEGTGGEATSTGEREGPALACC